MADAKRLARFSVTGARDTFTVHIGDDGGSTLELTATREQLDLIADALDDILFGDEDEVEEDGKTAV